MDAMWTVLKFTITMSLLQRHISSPYCDAAIVEAGGLASVSAQEFSKSSSNLSQLVPLGYDKYHPPPLINEKPRQVNFTVTIWDIDEVSEKDMSIKYTMTLRMYWHDHRLNLPDLKAGERRTLESSLLAFIWMPNAQLREGRAFTKPTLIHDPVALRVYPGQLLSISKLTLVHAHCPMDFRFYPMDVQTCEMTLQAFGYTADEVVLDWAKSVKDSVFQVSNTASGKFDFWVEADEYPSSFTSHGSRRRYSSLKFRIVLERRLSFYLMQTYLPSSLLVFLSWLSYFVPPKGNLAARMTLCTVTIMATSTMLASIQTTLPEVSYPKAIDVWMVNCLVFQVLALLEFCIIIQMSRESTSTESGEEGLSRTPDVAPDDGSNNSRRSDEDSTSTDTTDESDEQRCNGVIHQNMQGSTGWHQPHNKDKSMTRSLFVETGNKTALALPPIDTIASPGTKNLFFIENKCSSSSTEALFGGSLTTASFGLNKPALAPIRKRVVATFPKSPGDDEFNSITNAKRKYRGNAVWAPSKCFIIRFIRAAYRIWRTNPHPMDRWASVLIPVGFFAFNLIYWFTYMQQNRRQVH